MPEGQVLEFSGITKRFGAVSAVADLTAAVEPGRVTGFLGPNGAGKTTSLRILLGLVRPTSGTATIGGVAYASLRRPLQTVGAVLEASSFHPGRTAANHLKVYAQAAGLPLARVDETLGLVGLADVGGRKVGGFSLGMRQRLGLAYALLGDPGVLVLDEPANGLDPEGIKWMRGFLRQLAREGRTVFVSSHLLAEVQQTVDSVLIISQGRLVYQGALEDLADPSEFATVVDSPDRAALVAALTAAGAPFELLRSGLTVRGLDPAAVGAIAASAGVALSSLQRRGPALEEVFLDLVSGVRVHPIAMAAVEGGDTGSLGAGVAGAAATGVAASGAAASSVAGAEADEAAPDAEAPPEDRDADAAAGAADAATADEERSADETAAVAEGLASEGANAPGAAVAAGAAALASHEGARDTAAETVVDPTPTATFAVASTGVIDIVPFTAGDPATDAYQDDLPLDADPDVEALGAIDEELSTPDLPADPEDPVAGDRPWETYVRTDADLEADAFFASFTATDAEAEAPTGTAAAADAERPFQPKEPSEPDRVPDAAEPDRVPEAAEPASDPEHPAEQASDPEHADGAASDREHADEAASDPEDSDGAASPREDEAEPASEASPPDDDTSELGTLADLSPDWVEHDVHADRDDEGDAQR
jgi:ABC-2 type transport system ATP-binding protein